MYYYYSVDNLPNSTSLSGCLSLQSVECKGSARLDTRRRTLVKAVVWQLLGFATMALTGWIFTGSATQGGVIAVTGTFCGFVTYFIYERVWSGIRWGRLGTHDDRGGLLEERLAARLDANLNLRRLTRRLVTSPSFPSPGAIPGSASGSASRVSDTP